MKQKAIDVNAARDLLRAQMMGPFEDLPGIGEQIPKAVMDFLERLASRLTKEELMLYWWLSHGDQQVTMYLRDLAMDAINEQEGKAKKTPGRKDRG